MQVPQYYAVTTPSAQNYLAHGNSTGALGFRVGQGLLSPANSSLVSVQSGASLGYRTVLSPVGSGMLIEGSTSNMGVGRMSPMRSADVGDLAGINLGLLQQQQQVVMPQQPQLLQPIQHQNQQQQQAVQIAVSGRSNSSSSSNSAMQWLVASPTPANRPPMYPAVGAAAAAAQVGGNGVTYVPVSIADHLAAAGAREQLGLVSPGVFNTAAAAGGGGGGGFIAGGGLGGTDLSTLLGVPQQMVGGGGGGGGGGVLTEDVLRMLTPYNLSGPTQ